MENSLRGVRLWELKKCQLPIRRAVTPIVPPDEFQYLTIETDTACSPTVDDALNEGSFYFNVKTDKWSINSADELAMLIEDENCTVDWLNQLLKLFKIEKQIKQDL